MYKQLKGGCGLGEEKGLVLHQVRASRGLVLALFPSLPDLELAQSKQLHPSTKQLATAADSIGRQTILKVE